MSTPAQGRGGYRQPERGAPVSGPGPLSQRTDGPQGGQPVRVPTGGAYGEASELRQLQEGAPLSDGGGVDLSGLTEFGAPSAGGGMPITDGAAMGEGGGLDALGLSQQADEDLQRLLTYLPVLERMANVPGASRAARNLVRDLKSRA